MVQCHTIDQQVKCNDINLPILNFQKDFNKKSSWDQPHEKPQRRYNMYQIDNYWRKCFGQNRKRSLLINFTFKYFHNIIYTNENYIINYNSYTYYWNLYL